MTIQSLELTLGQKRVRASFNPSNDSVVDLIKEKAADLIDYIEDHRKTDDGPELARLWSLAQTQVEDAAMWAVKAATTGKP